MAGEFINPVLIDVHHFSQRIHGYRDGLSSLTDMGHRGFSLGDGLNAVIILSFHLSQLLLIVLLLGDQFKNCFVHLFEVFTKLLSEIVVEVLDNGFQSGCDLCGR